MNNTRREALRGIDDFIESRNDKSENLNLDQKPSGNDKTDKELQRAKELINEYCAKEFDKEADFSDLSHVDLAFSTTSNSVHTIEVYANLIAHQIRYCVDGKVIGKRIFDSLPEMYGLLGNLDFDQMVAEAESVYAFQQAVAAAATDVATPEPSLKEELSQPPVDHGLEQPTKDQASIQDIDR